jgi:hypothetical protein
MILYKTFIKTLIPLLLAITSFTKVQAQQFSIEDIPLTWKDFTVKEGFRNHPFDAKIYTNTPYNWKIKNKDGMTSLVISTELIVSPEKSWVKKEFLNGNTKTKTQELLNHEKGHFIIALIHFKKVQKILSEYTFHKQQVKFQLDSIFKSSGATLGSMNEIYDNETNHMLIVDKQQEWIKNLLQQLNELYAEDKKLSMKFEIEVKI